MKRNKQINSILGMLLVILATGNAQQKEPIAYWNFDDTGKTTLEVVASAKDSIHYIFNTEEPFSDPLRKPGIKGTSLAFDGFSSWITHTSDRLINPWQELTVSVWVAPRAFEHGDAGKLSAIVNQQDKLHRKGFVLGIFRHGGWSFQIGTGNTWTELWVTDHPLPRREWSFITATFSASSGRINLYLNGEPVAYMDVTKSISIQPANVPLLIGKHNQAEQTGTFDGPVPVNMFNGFMDELKIYDTALDADQIRKMYQRYLKPFKNHIPEIPYADMKSDRGKFKGAPYRPQYHAMPPGNWMNEPHAPFYYKGKYHLTYQHNPTGPYWHQIHWGHWVSDDMVHWKDVPEAIFPENDSIRPDGIWSGSAFFDAQDKPVLAYTFGNWDKKLNQGVAFSRPFDPDNPELVEWVEDSFPMVTQMPEQGLQGEFRDPFVWKDAKLERWYMLVGSGIEGQGGTAWCYVSDNMKDWNLQGPLYLSDYANYPFLGTIWELPVLLPLGTYPNGDPKYIFIISPKGKGENVEVYYWLGQFDKNTYKFVPDDPEPNYFNYGDGTYIGPSGFIDPKTGRVIIYTIAAGGHGPGWAGAVSLPEELFLDEKGKLNMRPISELESLRSKEILSMKNATLEQVNEKLKSIHEELLEIKMEIKLLDAEEFKFSMFTSPDGRETTTLFYNEKTQKLGLDTSVSSLTPSRWKRVTTDTRDQLKGHFELDDSGLLMLHIYIDKSLLEIFANDQKAITKWIYPTLSNATEMQISIGSGKALIKQIQIWKLNTIWDENK